MVVKPERFRAPIKIGVLENNRAIVENIPRESPKIDVSPLHQPIRGY
jgi:hypothetical protein